MLQNKTTLAIRTSCLILWSCGTSGTGETPQAQCLCARRRLTARPEESEHPGAEIPPLLYQQCLRKQRLEKSLFY